MIFSKNPSSAPVHPTPLGGFTISNKSSAVDAYASTAAFHRAAAHGTPAGTEIDYHFNDPISSPGRRVHITKIRFRKTNTDQGRVTINGDQFEANWSNTEEPINLGDNLGYVTVPVNKNFGSLDTVILFLETQGTTNLEASLYQVRIFGYFVKEEFEFNDSVLETKGWNSSRYDGRQLSAAKRNQFTPGDVTYGKTPVVERYTRNIYIGNKVVDLTEGTVDSNFLPIDNFSYVQTNYYITINEDGSITHNRLKPTTTRTTQKIGFYQSFFDDFPDDKGCRLIIYDPKVKNNLKSNYPIYFNGGQFQQILKYKPRTDVQTDYHVDYSTIGNNIRLEAFLQSGNPNNPNSGIRAKSEILNNNLIREFYPLPLEALEQSSTTSTIRPSTFHLGFYNSIDAFKTGSSYKNNRRYYITLTNSGSNSPIRTIATGSIPAGSDTTYFTNNLAELSTIEYISASIDGPIGLSLRLHGNNRTKLNFDYDGGDLSTGPETLNKGNVILSKVSDDIPSLLLNLDASVELPDGVGDRPFIIVPENLHPYVEDNLIFYLSKAGINISGEATKTVAEITANKPRKPRLTPGVRKAIVRGRRRRLQLEEESNRDRRQRERQNRRKKRKQNREDRKENRQENRQKRRENRQDRRQNRRNRRRNR